ncbi:MAG: hypothetical protein WBD46_05905 [Acidobacteriaceae bacterium]
MKFLRSAASVLLSYIVVYGIVLVSDPIIAHFFPGQYVPGKIPSNPLLWLGTAVFAAASILGGWLCVRIAPSRPGFHLFVLFLVGEILGLWFTWRMWTTWPHWYSLSWLLVWPVCLWIGSLGRRSD